MRKTIRTILRVLTAVVLATAVNSFCFARQQSSRFPVELEVLAANARIVLSTGYSARYKHGIKLRIGSSLGSLRFLARQYLAAANHTDGNLFRQIEELRIAYKERDWLGLARISRSLAGRYPLVLTHLAPRYADAQAIVSGRHIYQNLCIGCHEHPDNTRAVPAPDLFAMARDDSTRELIARLISGVHGTPAVALHNPFSDMEIAGLAAYLKNYSPQHH